MSVAIAILFTPIVLVVLAFAVGRLLGVARRLRANLVATVGGYISGSIVAYNIAGGDITDTSFGWSQLYLAVLAAMALAVLQELLTPVLAEGRSDTHRVGTSLRARIRRTQRLRSIVANARRHGLLNRHAGTDPETPARLRATLEEAGGIFVKLGQVLATRPELVPPHYVHELEKLHRSVEPEPVAAIRAVVERELGRSIDEVFSRFDDEPLAAGSVGQVHTARLHPRHDPFGSASAGGAEVVVKVQRPGIDTSMRTDLDVLRRLADVLERRTTWANQLNVGAQIDDFVANLESELDFTIEAANLVQFSELLRDDTAVQVPRLQPTLCTSRVVVMEHFRGPSCSTGTPSSRPDRIPTASHDSCSRRSSGWRSPTGCSTATRTRGTSSSSTTGRSASSTSASSVDSTPPC